MDVDFLTRDGVERACKHCDNTTFITNYAILERLENERETYTFRCKECGNGSTFRLRALTGYRQTQLYRIHISG